MHLLSMQTIVSDRRPAIFKKISANGYLPRVFKLSAVLHIALPHNQTGRGNL
jgi:hypothetical protein